MTHMDEVQSCERELAFPLLQYSVMIRSNERTPQKKIKINVVFVQTQRGTPSEFFNFVNKEEAPMG